MTDALRAATGSAARLRALNAQGRWLPRDLVALAARVLPTMAFRNSGLAKVEGQSIKDGVWFPFGQVDALPVIPPARAAVAATPAEHLQPVLLSPRLTTHVAGAGRLAMTLVIQVVALPDAWVSHGLWAACCMGLVAHGPGRASLDRLAGLDRRGSGPGPAIPRPFGSPAH